MPLVVAVVIVGTLGFLAGAAAAEVATVRYDGRALFKVSSTTEDAARARAAEIARRISALADANRGSIVEIVLDGAERRLEVRGTRIATVTTADADEHASTVDELAQTWALEIQGALRDAAERAHSPARQFGANIVASIRAAFGGVLESSIDVVPRVIAALLVLGFFSCSSRCDRSGSAIASPSTAAIMSFLSSRGVPCGDRGRSYHFRSV